MPPWPWTPAAASWSPGRAEQDRRLPASSRSATTPWARRAARSSGSTPTPRAPSRCPGRHGRGWHFVVVWRARAGPELLRHLRPALRRRGHAGGAEFGVNASVANNQTRAQVARDPRGAFIVVWDSDPQDGSHTASSAGCSTRTARPTAGTSGSTPSPRLPAAPGLAANDGRLRRGLGANGQDGDGNGVFARRFRSDLIFRDGFDAGRLPLVRGRDRRRRPRPSPAPPR